MNVGIIGCGSIASSLHKCMPDVNVIGVFDRHIERAEKVANTFGAKWTDNFKEFLEFPCDLVIEVASVEAVKMYAMQILSKGCSLVILSSGALAEDVLKQTLETLASQKNAAIHVPSGAVFGLDNAGIGHLDALDYVSIRTIKPPHSFGLSSDDKKCLFKGSAFDCIKVFPKNANVSISLALATGLDVETEIWVDPAIDSIQHTILMQGEFGSVDINIKNIVSSDNPSSSHLAMLSVCRLIQSLQDSLTIGS